MKIVSYHFLLILSLASSINCGDRSSSPESIISISHNSFDHEFTSTVKSKLYHTYTNYPQRIINTLNALNTNLEKEKISIAMINKKFSKIMIGSLCMSNSLFFIYAQLYVNLRNLFCSRDDECINLGFKIKDNALDEYLAAIVVPWIVSNFLILGVCAYVHKKQVQKAYNHNAAIDRNRVLTSRFLGSLQSGTFIPDTI